MNTPRLGNARSENANLPRILAYVADLELEVDRLRRHNQLIVQELRDALLELLRLCNNRAEASILPNTSAEMTPAIQKILETLQDLRDLPGYHPAHDQVIAIAVRPLIEQVFRVQQRFLGVPDVVLQLELESDHVEWFPARLRHILDHLLSNALKYRDPAKGDQWVRVRLRVSSEAYELGVSDNGVGIKPKEMDQVFNLFYRAAPAREAGLGMGLPVVKLLVEQSNGALTAHSDPGRGSLFTVLLPRYEMDDYLI